MAITRTDFTGTTQAANAPEVLAWLQANAAEYFDTIAADENGNVSCKIGETTVLLLGFDGNTSSQVTLINGTSITHHEKNDRFTYAIKTSNGVYLNSYNFGSVFITKSNKGTTAVAWNFKTSMDNYGYLFADFTYSPDFYRPIAGSWDVARNTWVHAAPLTALTPAVFNGGCYAPNLFITTLSEYTLIKCIFSIDGTEYASDGVLALKD